MTIWDEKPKSDPLNLVCLLKVPEAEHQVYKASEMDAWLEKVKIEYDKLCREYTTIFLLNEKLQEKAEKWDSVDEMNKVLFIEFHEMRQAKSKLEAIRTYIKNNLYAGALVTGSQINDIKKILEGEG